jgi:hypothetical protein
MTSAITQTINNDQAPVRDIVFGGHKLANAPRFSGYVTWMSRQWDIHGNELVKMKLDDTAALLDIRADRERRAEIFALTGRRVLVHGIFDEEGIFVTFVEPYDGEPICDAGLIGRLSPRPRHDGEPEAISHAAGLEKLHLVVPGQSSTTTVDVRIPQHSVLDSTTCLVPGQLVSVGACAMRNRGVVWCDSSAIHVIDGGDSLSRDDHVMEVDGVRLQNSMHLVGFPELEQHRPDEPYRRATVALLGEPDPWEVLIPHALTATISERRRGPLVLPCFLSWNHIPVMDEPAYLLNGNKPVSLLELGGFAWRKRGYGGLSIAYDLGAPLRVFPMGSADIEPGDLVSAHFSLWDGQWNSTGGVLRLIV